MHPLIATVRAAFGVPSSIAILAVTLIAAGNAAKAESPDGMEGAGKKDGWDVTLGAGVAMGPAYPGSEKYRAQPIPMVNITYRDRIFLGPQGLGANVINWRGLRIGPVIGFDMGRSSSDDHHIDGLRDIQTSGTAGGFLSYENGPYAVSATLRQAVIHSEGGLTGKIEAQYRHQLIPQKMSFGIGPEIDFGDGKNMQTWFGVTPAEAARSRFHAYTASGGVKDIGVNAYLSNRFTDHIIGRVFVDVKELVGDAADSPIVQQKTEATIGVGVAYHF